VHSFNAELLDSPLKLGCPKNADPYRSIGAQSNPNLFRLFSSAAGLTSMGKGGIENNWFWVEHDFFDACPWKMV